MRTLLLLAPLLALACASSRTVPCVNAPTTPPTASGSATATATATATFRTRRALVIGNGNHASLSALPNAVTEAESVHAALRASGFEATLLTNATAERMRNAIAALEQESTPEDLVVLYYAGIGANDGQGGSLWFPTDAPEGVAALNTAVHGADVGRRFARRARTTLIFSTAARIEMRADAAPGPAAQPVPVPARSRKPGIQLRDDDVNSIGGVLFVSACAPGEATLDDVGVRFGQTFAREVTAGATLTSLLTSLSQTVDASGGRNHLWIEGSVVAPFVLRSPSASR